MKTRQGQLADIDRMLADIDRALFVLPAGGSVSETYWGCWADLYRPHQNMTYTCGAPLLDDWELTMGLCADHYREMTA